MTIVLNEHEWAEEMIENHSLGKKPFETLWRVARYYLDDGLSKRDVKRSLESFLIQSDPTASIPKWSGSIDCAIQRAVKYPAVHIEEIPVTKPEMAKIDSLPGKQARRLAFTLLCLSKYWAIVSGRKDGWINNKDADIMRMANINTSIKRQSLMYYNLREAGMIEFSKKVDNTNVRVCFGEEGDVVLRVTDFRNLGYQYMMYHGGSYFVCKNCGITEKVENPNKGRKQKYCKKCTAEIAIQRRVSYSMGRSEAHGRREKKFTVYMHKFQNGNVYIGATSQNLRDRWKNGVGYKGSNVGKAIQEYGWDSVRHFILFDGLDKESSQCIEAYMINKYKSYLPQYGYNVKDRTSCKQISNDVYPHMLMMEVDGDGNPV